MEANNTVPNPSVAIFTAGGANTNDMFDQFPASGFNTIVLWSMGVDIDGNIHIRNFGSGELEILAGNGGIFNPGNNPDIVTFREKVANLKVGSTSVTRVELSFGVGTAEPDPTFPNIKAIYESQLSGPSPSSNNLLANIHVLQQALSLDAVSFDDEVSFDQASSLWLAQQCGFMGMTVSICPFGDSGYWSGLVLAANQNQTLIDTVYVQSWVAGVENWAMDNINPSAGLWVSNPGEPVSPSQATQQFEAWLQQAQLSGGWYYNAGDIYQAGQYTQAEYAQAIISAFPTVKQTEKNPA